MIRIKFEVEEQEETPLPIESENDRIKRILSLKFFGNNLNNSTSDNTNNGNNNNVSGILKPSKKSPEKNSVVPKKKPKLVNSTTNSVVAVGSKSIKTEPVESSLSLTTQLNNSLNIQSLLRQNRIQNGWTTNEQSIPIGTQQQQQSLFLPKIEPIVPGIHQEVPLSLSLNFLISNLNPNSCESTTNCDTTEVSFLDQCSSSIPIGTRQQQQQQQQQSLALPKIEPIVSENQEISEFLGSRASLGRKAKLKVCHSVPIEPEPVARRRKKVSEELPTPEPPTTITTTIQRNSAVAGISESTNNNDNCSDQDSISGFGSISGVDPSFLTAPLPEAAVPLLVGNKPLPLGIPPLTLEERKARHRETSRLWYLRKKTIPKQPLDPEVKAEKLRRKREYNRKWRKQLLDRATPEQLKLRRLKEFDRVRRRRENESEEQRQRRLERARQYHRTVAKQRKEQKWQTMTPEERGKIRLKWLERVRRQLENETDEHRKRRLEQKRQHAQTVGKQRRQQKRETMTPEEREFEQQTSMSSSTSLNLVVDNSGKSSTTISTKKMKSPKKQCFELSMSIDSDSSHFDSDDGDIDCETNNTLVESPKPGPSKLPDRSARRCQRNLKSKIYSVPSTYTDTDSD